MLTLVLNRMVFARLLASDFPSENPRSQTRNFPYTNTLPVIMTRPEIRLHNFKHYVQKRQSDQTVFRTF